MDDDRIVEEEEEKLEKISF